MKKEHSYGIIPFRLSQKKWEVLLVQHQAGHWSFPKGHCEKGESPREAAERELFEETGLKVLLFFSDSPLLEHYFFTYQGQRISKNVSYFPAQVEGKVILQEKEIQGSQWLFLGEAEDRITFPEGKQICERVRALFPFLSS